MVTKYIAGVAAIALSATALVAEPGGGNGKGGGGGGNGPDKHQGHEQAPGGAKGGGGNGKAHGGGADRGGSAQQAQVPRQDKEPGRENGRAKGPDLREAAARGKPEKQARGQERGNQGRDDKAERNAQNANSRGNGNDQDRFNDDRSRNLRSAARESGGAPFRWASLNRRDAVKGCPPGLAKKNNGCTPPGLAADRTRDDGWGGYYDRPDWWGYDGYEGRYSYYDGSLLQLGSNGSILGYLPLLGGALAPGNLWPSSSYGQVAVPDYYENYYGLGSDDSYRYYDDAFYAVDPQTQAISSIAALLTGNDFAVGQQLPQGYDVYNVPYSYRDEYVDGPDAAYRYSDGYVYEVDPTTQLIRTAIELLT